MVTRTRIEKIERIEARNKSLGQILKLYLEERSFAKVAERKALVHHIKARFNVSPATAYDYANALKILVDDSEEQSALESNYHVLSTYQPRNRLDALKFIVSAPDPPLTVKMKKYGRSMIRDFFYGGGPFPCDRNVFLHRFAMLIEKIGRIAFSDPDFRNAPKALTEACFIKTMELMNPLLEVHGVRPHEDALRYVEWALRYEAKKRTKKKRRLTNSTEYTAKPSYGGIEVIYNRNKPVKAKYLKGLDMWFMLPGEPIANAFMSYCYDKEIFWQDAVRGLLAKQLGAEGYSVAPA